MDTIRTATNKVFDSDYLATIPQPEQAFIRICNKSLAEVAAVFGSRDETIQLWYGDVYLAMYTKLVALVPESGAIKVILAKE